MNSKPPLFDGALLAARYAFMPNKLRYCGGDKNSRLFDYAAYQESDGGLQELLAEFATMYPYLRLIAAANKILDHFDYRVVEAYWLGNDLLRQVDMKNFYRYLIDEHKLKKSFKPKLLEKVFGQIPLGAKPHHSWHVLNMPKRTGHYPVEHTLLTMDKCRIAAAQVKSLKTPVENSLGGIIVAYQPLVFKDEKIAWGEMVEKEVYWTLNNKSFMGELKVGDFVSLHWDWVCDILTSEQLSNLNKWTDYNLRLANISLLIK